MAVCFGQLHGTGGHFFYKCLDARFVGTAPLTVAKKVLIDQTLWNTSFNLIFFGYLNCTQPPSAGLRFGQVPHI
eukprot:COSAG01_NODE_1530_length_9964_cov_5.649879_2_plen_74_part_00